MPSWTRREFLRESSLGLGAVTLAGGLLGCENGIGSGLLEGVYPEKSCFRHGEDVVFRVALRSGLQIPVDVLSLDGSVTTRVRRDFVTPTDKQRLLDPGMEGAGFQTAIRFPASDLPPGFYEVRIPPSDMQPENVTNTANGYTSENWRAPFVVTNANPGSRSRLLWLHDSLSGTAYGSFGDRSIYGNLPVRTRAVHRQRPGLGRSTDGVMWPMRLFKSHGYDYEYADLVSLAAEPIGFLAAYDAVVAIGQFEYMPHEVLAHLDDHLNRGGHLFAASHEFGSWRVRLDSSKLTTYKDAGHLDPLLALLPSQPHLAPLVAGTGMHADASFYETEIIGQTVWLGMRAAPGYLIDMPTYRHSEYGWLYDLTGLGPGDSIPAAFTEFATGNFLDASGSEPLVLGHSFTRTPLETKVWGAASSSVALAYYVGRGIPKEQWPLIPGHATATIQERPSGALVVALPSSTMATQGTFTPLKSQLLLNIMDEIS